MFENNFKDITHHNLLNSCLFVVNGVKLLKSSIENKGYNIKGGPQSSRGQISSLSNQLNCMDGEFRYALYNHSLYHCSDYRQVAKDIFSFRNIHMNLGNVRWFSTPRVNNAVKSTSSEKKNRQDLFKKNYNIILELLNNNYNLGSEELQIKIEKLLQQQENLFAENNISDLKLMKPVMIW